MKKVNGLETKIALVERGIPIDISEKELEGYEDVLRKARSFYIDMLLELDEARKVGVDELIRSEEHNLASVEKALRKVDNARLVIESKKIDNMH